MSSKKSKPPADAGRDVADATSGEQPPTQRRTAMRLPDGVLKKPASGPAIRWAKGVAPHGRAQKDAARRLGKDRKVH